MYEHKQNRNHRNASTLNTRIIYMRVNLCQYYLEQSIIYLNYKYFSEQWTKLHITKKKKKCCYSDWWSVCVCAQSLKMSFVSLHSEVIFILITFILNTSGSSYIRIFFLCDLLSVIATHICLHICIWHDILKILGTNVHHSSVRTDF